MHIYERLGVGRVINAYECLTRLGGSIMAPEVLAAMTEAAEWFVDLDELQAKVGRRLADLVGVDAAFVTSGAAAGLTIATAACVAGTDPAKIAQLPDLRGLPDEVAIERGHRNRYDGAIRQAGVTLVEYGYPRGTEPWELEAVISSRTAAIAYFIANVTPTSLPLATVAEIAHRHQIPVIVDAAAEVPPPENLRRFVDAGGDLVVFSGGKGLRGPQCSGLILGRRELIAACAANANPRHSIGRPMKVGKEEIVGLLVALELYLREAPAARLQHWEAQVQRTIELLAGLPGVSARRTFPMPTGKLVPRVQVQIDDACPLPADQIIAALRQGEPRIEVRPDPAGFFIDPQPLQSGEIDVVCRRIREIVLGGSCEVRRT